MDEIKIAINYPIRNVNIIFSVCQPSERLAPLSDTTANYFNTYSNIKYKIHRTQNFCGYSTYGNWNNYSLKFAT